MSRWCFEWEGQYTDERTGLNYCAYLGVEPLRPLYDDDPNLCGIREWVRLVIVETRRDGECLGRNPHVDIYHDLDALFRARLHALDAEKSLFFVQGGLNPRGGEGPHREPHPPEVAQAIRDCESKHHIRPR